MFLPNLKCCQPPIGVNNIRAYLCDECRTLFDRYNPVNNFFQKGMQMSDFNFVGPNGVTVNCACSGEPGLPVPTLGFAKNRRQQPIATGDGPLPLPVLNFAKDADERDLQTY